MLIRKGVQAVEELWRGNQLHHLSLNNAPRSSVYTVCVCVCVCVCMCVYECV